MTNPVILYFNSGCEIDYMINSYRYLQHMTCTASIPKINIKAGETYTWTTLKHLPINYRLPLGKQKIKVGITASQINPFSGDRLEYELPLFTSAEVNIVAR